MVNKYENVWNSALFNDELCLLTQQPQAYEQRPFKQFFGMQGCQKISLGLNEVQKFKIEQ